jgi:ABC-type Fe3+ transport system substrate-binding protein
LTNSFILRAQKEGAPLEHAQVQPIVAPAYHVGVLKGSRRTNAAHLFASFLLAPEAQSIWERYNGQTSAFVPGTKMYNYVQGKDVIYLSQNDVDLVNRAVVEVNKILGFNP